MRRALAGYLLLYAALYGGYGALSPFLPAFLGSRGLAPSEIATILGGAMLVRLVAGPLAGRIADRTGATRTLLAASLALTGLLSLAFLLGQGFWTLLAIGLAQAVVTAPLGPLADALALAAARSGGFEYGWVRAAGSGAFIAATVLTGQLVAHLGLASGLWACTTLFVLAGSIARRVSTDPREWEQPHGRQEHGRQEHETGRAWRGFLELAALPRFRRLVLAAALVIGAHAMHDAFGIIRWSEAGIPASTASLLWSESVAAEILVFLLLGPRLLDRLGPARALALAALAGALRWTVEAETTWLPALIGIQCLHGLTFALLHLACLAAIEESVPHHLKATALAVYGALGLGLATALVTLVAGSLFERFGAQGFLAMSALSLVAVPIALSLRAELSR